MWDYFTHLKNTQFLKKSILCFPKFKFYLKFFIKKNWVKRPQKDP